MSSALERIVNFLQVFRHLNYHILMFFLAYIGIYRTPAGWYGQEPYLGPAHLWLWQNMGVWDEKIAPKWGGTANAQFRFSVSYRVNLACSCSRESFKLICIFHKFHIRKKLVRSRPYNSTVTSPLDATGFSKFFYLIFFMSEARINFTRIRDSRHRQTTDQR